MSALTAKTTARIQGTHDAWRVIPPDHDEQGVTTCIVRLAIEGSPDAGFHLVKDPEGFFPADEWYATQREALEAAFEDFGVTEADWSVEDRARGE